jgi:hypothetical protein
VIPFAGTLRAVVYTALIVGPAAYMKGCTDEALRFESFKGGVEALGVQAKAIMVARVERNKRIALEIQNENKSALDTLAGLYNKLRNQRASSSVVPPSSNPAHRASGTVCYSQEDLARAVGESLQGLRDETLGILQQGDEALIDRTSWGDWSRLVETPEQ